MEHASRFIELSNDTSAEAEIMTGSNLKQILGFLPLRVRQEDDSFDKAETNASKRKTQYMKVKSWIGKIHEKLLMSGVKLDEKTETQITMVTVTGQPQGRPQNDNSDNHQSYRNNRSQRQDRRNRQNTVGNPVTECGFCNLIKGKDVPQDYLSVNFDERHRNITNQSIWANNCLGLFRARIFITNEFWAVF